MYYAEAILLVIAVIQVAYALSLPGGSIARKNSLRLALCFGVIGSSILIWHLMSKS